MFSSYWCRRFFIPFCSKILSLAQLTFEARSQRKRSAKRSVRTLQNKRLFFLSVFYCQPKGIFSDKLNELPQNVQSKILLTSWSHEGTHKKVWLCLLSRATFVLEFKIPSNVDIKNQYCLGIAFGYCGSGRSFEHFISYAPHTDAAGFANWELSGSTLGDIKRI